MKHFQHINPSDIQTAAALLQEPGTAAIAGGTDLITELKKRSWYYRHPQLQCWLRR
ncbi:MAG: FAD binding domain-containing protein [Deltaproteobacteria bacterium]|nr:FAD binding domain-containing protein [Deltaproteobacteria bacterium]